MLVAMYVITVSLVIFVAGGFALLVSATVRARRERRAADAGAASVVSLRKRAQRYVGPVTDDMALANPAARVGIEFVLALCGFPGFGWLFSGRVVTGLLLVSIVPSFVWAIYPGYLSLRGQLLTGPSPYTVIEYLPALAAVSAGCLAIDQIVAARRRAHEHKIEATG